MENKTGKYLKYAIGEIILVVIGILLAVQINTWNEKRKSNDSIQRLLTVFETELEDNISNSRGLIRWSYRSDSILSLFIDKKVTRKMISNNPSLVFAFRTRTTDFTNDNLDELIAQEKQLPKKYATLVSQLKILKKRIDSRKKWEDIVVNLSMEYTKERADNFEWLMLSDSLSNEKRMDYVLSPINLNKIVHYNNIQLDENAYDASLIRTSCIALLWNIKALGNNKQPLDEFLNALRLNPWKEVDCNQKPSSDDYKVNFRTNFTIYNNSPETAYFNVLNGKDKSLSYQFTVKPKRFKLNQFYVNDGEILHQVDINGNCIKVFEQVKDGYIIIN